MSIQYPGEVVTALSQKAEYVHQVQMMGEMQNVLDVSVGAEAVYVYNDALQEAQVRADVTAADVAPA